MLEPLESRRLLSAGEIDPTFGANGKVDFPELGFPIGHSVLTPAGNGQFFLFEYSGLHKINADGSTVTSFGHNGIAAEGLQPLQVVFQPNGKILVNTWTPDQESAFVLRLNADGTPDNSFGQQGVVDLNALYGTPSNDEILLQSDGKIVIDVTGSAFDQRRLLRLNADGSDDPSFHEFDFGLASLGAFALQSGDRIVIGGELFLPGRDDVADLIRLTADGTLDTTFGTDGIASGEYLLPEEFTFIPGGGDAFYSIDSGAQIRKYSANGILDTSFGTNGIVDSGIYGGGGSHLLPAAGGKWLVFDTLGMARLNADFSRDNSFARLWADDTTPRIMGASFNAAGDILIATSNPYGEEDALQRLHGSSGGTSATPISLSGSTVTVTGTESDDDILVSSNVPAFTGLVARVAGQFGRVFDSADVSRVTVLAQGGNDRVNTSITQSTSVSGGDGDDVLIGGEGDESLSGNAGRDALKGGGGNDRLAGNGGRDKLGGGDGNDILFGGAGRDGLAGEAGNDILKGDAGNDALWGGDGTDTFARGTGDDWCFTFDTLPESIFGDAGNDWASDDDNDILFSIEG
jgi:uncharacterized delta-60 repeat protein